MWHGLHSQTRLGGCTDPGQTSNSRHHGAKAERESSGHPDVWRRLRTRGTGQIEIDLGAARRASNGLGDFRSLSFCLADFRSLDFPCARASSRSGIGERSARWDPDLRFAGSAIRGSAGRKPAGSRSGSAIRGEGRRQSARSRRPAGSRGPLGSRGPARSRRSAAGSSRWASRGQASAPWAVRDLESVTRSRAPVGQVKGNADLWRGCPASRGACAARFLLHAAIRVCLGGLGCPGWNRDASLRGQAPA